MPCPTCSHTLQYVAFLDDRSGVWWCGRCGSLRTIRGDRTEDAVPKLVERCRKLQEVAPLFLAQWHHLGIAEAIRPEDQRP